VLKALSDPTRLRIVKDLLRCVGPFTVDREGMVRDQCGLTVGEVCCQITGVEKQSSTISHHLRELRLAGLVDVERRGRHMVHTVNLAKWKDLNAYFSQLSSQVEEGCAGS